MGANKYRGRLWYLLGPPQSLPGATELSEHLRHWRRPGDSSDAGRLGARKAPSVPEVAHVSQKLEHAQKTGGRLKYGRAPSLFGETQHM